MPDKVDMSLDDVVKSDKGGKRGGGRGGGGGAMRGRGGGNRGARAPAPYQRPVMMARGGFAPRGGRGGFPFAPARAQAFETPRDGGFFMHDDRETETAAAPVAELSTAGTKMLVSNLGPEVTDEDLKELFVEHGGPIKKAEIFYKQDGTSSGQGEVVFKKRADADKAIKTLNNVPLDGKPLQLALVGVSSAAAPQPARGAGATTVTITGVGGAGPRGGGFAGGYAAGMQMFGGGGGGFRGGGRGGFAPRGGGRGAARGGARGGRGGGARGGAKEKKLDEAELDQGMEGYWKE